VGQILPGAFIARVSDAAGNFIAGVPVTWQVVTGGGVLEQVDTQTNLNGVALGIYRLGTMPSTNSVRVTANGLLLSADFGATAIAGPPASLEPVAGDGQTGLPGASLAPFTVQVTDEFGNVLPGVTVRWTVLDGGGALSSETSATDITGRASVSYQLSQVPGTAHVRAEAGSPPVSTVFTATAAEPPTESSTRSPQPDPRRARSGGSRRAD
jgi:adhesin/invasin